MGGKPRLDTRWADCEEWPQACNAGGYGIRTWHGKFWLAHRAAWTQENGEIPYGLDVLHHCDNPPCINIGHLYLGTDADNGADKRARGRGRTGDKRGERNSYARLTEDDVRLMRRLYDRGLYNQKELDIMFGLVHGNAHYVVRRKTWRHIVETA